MFASVPVCGIWHIDISGGELQDLPSGAYPAVWVRLNLEEVRGQAIMGILRSWRNIQLQLSCYDTEWDDIFITNALKFFLKTFD